MRISSETRQYFLVSYFEVQAVFKAGLAIKLHGDFMNPDRLAMHIRQIKKANMRRLELLVDSLSHDLLRQRQRQWVTGKGTSLIAVNIA